MDIMLTAIGFGIGFLIPLFSLRFGKFMPADAGTSLSYMFHIPRFPRLDKKLLKKWGRLLAGCVLSGILAAAALCYLDHTVGGGYPPAALAVFVFLLGLLAHIDWRTMYLPDVLTVPLLLFGFYFAKDYDECVAGALYGYFMPTLVAALVCRFKADCFGGGDVKILAALGAWLGVIGVSAAIVLSVAVFILMLLVTRKKSGPYGPAICFGAFVVFAHADTVADVFSLLCSAD